MKKHPWGSGCNCDRVADVSALFTGNTTTPASSTSANTTTAVGEHAHTPFSKRDQIVPVSASGSHFPISSFCSHSTLLLLLPLLSRWVSWPSSWLSSPGSSSWWKRRGRPRGRTDRVPRSSRGRTAWRHQMHSSYQRRKDSFELLDFCVHVTHSILWGHGM